MFQTIRVLRQIKKPVERLQEILEHKFKKKVVLHLLGNLEHEIFHVLFGENLVLVVDPPMLEVSLYTSFDLNINVLFLVKVLHDSEEARQFVAVSGKLSAVVLVRVDHVD